MLPEFEEPYPTNRPKGIKWIHRYRVKRLRYSLGDLLYEDLERTEKLQLISEGVKMYVYIRSEPNLWTVGFYGPDGKWNPESDYPSQEEAAERVAWLNGSRPTLPTSIQEALNSGDGVYRP